GQLKALFYPVKAVLPGMVARKRGSIAVVGASLSRHPVAGFLPIAAAKSIAEVAIKTIAREVGPSGGRVNGVGPNLVMTATGRWKPTRSASSPTSTSRGEHRTQQDASGPRIAADGGQDPADPAVRCPRRLGIAHRKLRFSLGAPNLTPPASPADSFALASA